MAKSIEELQSDQIRKVTAQREQEQRDNPRQFPRRPKRPTIWVRPTSRFKESGVLDGGGGFITEPTEVDANDNWMLRRIQDDELEVIGGDEVKQLVEAAAQQRKQEEEAAANPPPPPQSATPPPASDPNAPSAPPPEPAPEGQAS